MRKEKSEEALVEPNAPTLSADEQRTYEHLQEEMGNDVSLPPVPQGEYGNDLVRNAFASAIQRLKEAHDLDVRLREEYVPKLFLLVAGWLTITAFVVIYCMFWNGSTTITRTTVDGTTTTVVEQVSDIGLPDTVFVAFLATSLSTVVGLFIAVAGWLFPKRSGRNG